MWQPAAKRAGLPGTTFHGLRRSFVAILVAAGCNVREVSEWAGHNNVAFTLTRYGGLFEDGSDEAVDQSDHLGGRRIKGRKASGARLLDNGSMRHHPSELHSHQRRTFDPSIRAGSPHESVIVSRSRGLSGCVLGGVARRMPQAGG